MAVTINSSYTITPSDPSSTTIIPLSSCDQSKLPYHISQLYLYTCSSFNSSSMENLRASLSKALNLYYPLAGRLTWIHAGRLQLLCNSKGVTLSEAMCHHTTLDQLLRNLDNSVLLEQFFPKVDYGVDLPIEEMPLLAAQITRLPCNGVVLGVTVSLIVVDGTALGYFMSAWSKLARGEEDLDSSLLVPFHDRGLLDSLGASAGPRFEHAEFVTPPLWDEEEERRRNESGLGSVVLKLNKLQVDMLKKKAHHHASKDGFDNGSTSNSSAFSSSKPYTSFEVISGHLWRCLCKVKNEGNWGHKTMVHTDTVVDCRNRFKPNLPQNYFGNARFPTVTPTCCFDDIVHKPLAYAVANVRKTIERMNEEYLRSAIDYIANQKDMNSFRKKLYNLEGNSR